jgi:hypothetical protein
MVVLNNFVLRVGMIFWSGGAAGPVEAIYRQTPWSVTFRGLVPKKKGGVIFFDKLKKTIGAKINSSTVFFFDNLSSNLVFRRIKFFWMSASKVSKKISVPSAQGFSNSLKIQTQA